MTWIVLKTTGCNGDNDDEANGMAIRQSGLSLVETANNKIFFDSLFLS